MNVIKNDTDDLVLRAVRDTSSAFELLDIDPKLSDTAQFCAHYGFPLERAANTLLLGSRAEPKKFCVCVVLATTKIDVNRCVRKLIGAKASFVNAEEMQKLTGMKIGAVTPFGISQEIPVYVDAAVLKQDWVILGAGKRDKKIKISPEAILKLSNAQPVLDLAVAKPS